MTRNTIGLTAIFLVVALSHFASAAAVSPQQLTPQAERITDQKIRKDYKAFDVQQTRIRALNVAGVPVTNYYLAKAQAYLDLAIDEYHENDRSSIVEQAFGESDNLLRALESGAKEISLATYPLEVDKRSMPESAGTRLPENRLRPDLWALAERIKQHEQFACAAAPTAQFEVELLQAIHEDTVGGWRRTSPYIAIAESLSARAQEALDDCAVSAKAVKPIPPAVTTEIAVKQPEPRPEPKAEPAPPVLPEAIAVKLPEPAIVAPPDPRPDVVVPASKKEEVMIILSDHVFFAFGRVDVTDAGQIRIREVASLLNSPSARDRRIFIDGHTDDRGDASVNQILSERRAEAVQRALIAAGIEAR